jgi:hypothetical protein
MVIIDMRHQHKCKTTTYPIPNYKTFLDTYIMSRYIAKIIYLEKPKRLIVWNRDSKSTIKLPYMELNTVQNEMEWLLFYQHVVWLAERHTKHKDALNLHIMQ